MLRLIRFCFDYMVFSLFVAVFTRNRCLMLYVTELNAMKTRPVRERVLIHEENLHSGLPITTTAPDLSDHPLGKVVCVCVCVSFNMYNKN